MGRSTGGGYQSCDLTQPWIIYHAGRTHERLWPIWSSARLRCHTRITLECCVCGQRQAASLPVPRLLPIGEHPEPRAFLAEHAHPDRGHPMSWVRPLANVDSFRRAGGADVERVMLPGDREAAS